MKKLLILLAGIMFVVSCGDNNDSPTGAKGGGQDSVSQKPVAIFSSEIQNKGELPANVKFTNDSKNADNASFEWSFGDGNTESSSEPTHSYDESGSYTVKLSVSSDNGSDNAIKKIFIPEAGQQYIDNFSDVSSTAGEEQVTLTLTLPSNSQISTGRIFYTHHSVPDTADVTIGTDKQAGDTVQVTIKDLPYSGSPYTFKVLAMNSGMTSQNKIEETSEVLQPLTASFTYSIQNKGSFPTDVQFTNKSKGSDDLTLNWSFGDESSSMAESPTHGYGQSGDYDVHLQVSAGERSDDTTQTITIPTQKGFTKTVAPGDDLGDIIDNSSDGEIIGLKPGTYTLSSTQIEAKSITLASTSGDPTDTKVNFSKFELKDTGAGIKFKGLELDGGGNSYFINLVSSNGNTAEADFKNIVVQNSMVHNTSHTILRGDRGSNSAFSIDTLRIYNSVMYDEEIAGYNYLTLGGVVFRRIEMVNSTFHNIGRKFIGWPKSLSKQLDFTPAVFIDHCTINGFGAGGKNNLIVDAEDNPVDIDLQNSIVANAPLPGEMVSNYLIRADGDGTTIDIKNNNFFNLYFSDAQEQKLTFPTDYSYLTKSNNLNLVLDWDASTTDFTLPAGSALRTQSISSGPIGDPRWAN